MPTASSNSAYHYHSCFRCSRANRCRGLICQAFCPIATITVLRSEAQRSVAELHRDPAVAVLAFQTPRRPYPTRSTFQRGLTPAAPPTQRSSLPTTAPLHLSVASDAGSAWRAADDARRREMKASAPVSAVLERTVPVLIGVDGC